MLVRDVGVGPAVLLLHGTPSPATDWMPLADQLSSRYRVLVPDLPGYGRSPGVDDPTIERVGDLLHEMLRARGVTSLAAIAGFSTGAYRAFDLILRHAIETEIVVSIAGVACFDQEARELRRSLAQQLRAEPEYINSAEVRGLMHALMLSPARIATHPDDVERVVGWRNVISAPALAAELEALAASRDLRPELAKLRARVYARVGELDIGCPPAWSEDIVRAAPHARLETVPGCAHALLVEDLVATNAAICRELA